ncbi:MAG: glycosyltransferase [Bacteroidaceae bacterium]|nr:glycosyltransferase [Bacteroidaceae bacterium]
MEVSSTDGAGSHPPLKITVATVTYNAAALIARTIESVERQDYPHVEHLVIDGNSTDDTLAQIHRYQERNSVAPVPHEVACLSEPDEGLYDAMNKALREATGDYILFLNAGDTLHDAHTLSSLAAVAEAAPQPPAVVYGDTDLYDLRGRFVRHRRLAPPPTLTWKSFRQGMLVCHQAFCARLDLARLTPYDLRYRFSADFDWCIRIMRQAARHRLPLLPAGTVVAHYLDDEGTTKKNHQASLRERFHIMARHYGLIPTALRHLWFVLRAFVKK